jgi:hypothetical protein
MHEFMLANAARVYAKIGIVTLWSASKSNIANFDV